MKTTRVSASRRASPRPTAAAAAVATRLPLLLCAALVTAGSALAGQPVYVINELGEEVTVFDTATLSVIATIPNVLSPVGVETSADGSEAYVVSYLDFVGDDGIRIYETAGNTEIARVATGVGFNTLQVEPSADGALLYATNEQADSISVIDRASLQVVATVPVGDSPIGLDLTPSQTLLLVTNSGEASVSFVDTGTLQVVATVAVGVQPNQVIVHPGGLTAYVTNLGSDSISVLFLPTAEVVDTIAVGTTPVSLTVTPDGTRAYVANVGDGTVSVIDLSSHTVIATLPVGNGPSAVQVRPDGEVVYVSNGGDDEVVSIDVATNTVTGSVAVGDLPTDLAVADVASVGGSTRGVNTTVAVCVNRSTAQVVLLPLLGATTWDCEAAGLLVSPGDLVQQTVRGSVP